MTKTALITGASRGIGLAFVQHYKSQGWRVIATARDVAAAKQLQQLEPSKLVSLDTRDENSILQLAEQLTDEAIDVVINNAGIDNHGSLETTTKASILEEFEVNSVGSFLVTRAFLPNLKAAVERSGSAVVAQITSRMASITDNTAGGSYGYRASKTALNMLNSCLSVDFKNHGVIALALHPGHVTAAMTSQAGLDESVVGLAQIIENATMEDTGKFFHSQGEVLSW
ncbi:hypothetical protein Poli38472_001108 [Pythium oligandrum]|uniref:C-factor n=1 Tax=Pythium oligandrum TaxID=41045 RepID=A0A8K1CU95_PYTOL|nr:hypothetical protein Poli38472_001108 [Pythium oligandrum]|eukprot:TMW68952.1 hypothetical protein Poli38472_001108 [Pythium oligandrum]